ncbi:MAG: hypothetical protein J0H66_09890 [Solirubrobacterales bacterium]|nr:hypothetical protein [Solirubrobacterales bacterium]OJU93757.1 MAG: hypothetical protein BGO23_14150 [Solirubrobacterales bacterium 67-14]
MQVPTRVVQVRRGTPGGLAISLLIAAAMLALAGIVFTGSAQAAKQRPVKTTASLKITTGTQKALLSQAGINVKVKGRGGPQVRISTRVGNHWNYFQKKVVRLGNRNVKQVKLRLTGAGKAQLSTCRAIRVALKGQYRRKVVRHGRKTAKRVVAKASRQLTQDQSLCGNKPPPPIEPKKSTCDPLDPTVCMQPWPSNFFTKEDPSTRTGLRLDIPKEATPENIKGAHIDPTDMNRADGFSPGNLITLKVPGVDNPAAFDNTGFVPITNMHAYTRPDAPALVLDNRTGERWPIWVELDSNPTSVAPDDAEDGVGGININPSNTGPVNLIIRPSKNFNPGDTYTVVLRDLKDADDNPVAAPEPFRKCRDGEEITDPELLYRCNELEQNVFPELAQDGISKNGLYLAWDFTVASTQSLTGRALEIRNKAFAHYGDTKLADRKVEGDSPQVDVEWICTEQNGTAPGPGCEDGPNPPEGADVRPEQPRSLILRNVGGYIRNVPCFLNKDGCPPGSYFDFDADGNLKINPDFTTDVQFVCAIPKSVSAGGVIHKLRPGLYGHGLLGDLNQIDSQDTIASEHDMMFCATNWSGFAKEDTGTVVSSLADVSNFNKAADRMQQGFVNFLMLGRALIHPEGFVQQDAFKVDPADPENLDSPDAEPIIDTSQLYYEGKSQGGIMGGALTALSPDFTRAVLNVPGMNYSTLLQRSVDFDEYANLPGLGLYVNYPDQANRQLVISMMQLLWDRGEPDGYAQYMTDNPLPNTPPHQVLMQVDVGDHQVANVSAEVEARTAGIPRLAPTLNLSTDPALSRHWDVNPFLGIPAIPSTDFPYTGSAFTYWDGGPPGAAGLLDDGTAVAPPYNVPPREEWGYGGDPHSYSRDDVQGRSQAAAFMSANGTVQPCLSGTATIPCYDNGWDGQPAP